jgi:hypothetical protein
MFDYVEFTGDNEFLKSTAVPWLKEAALFYLSLLRKDYDGYYHIMRADAPETYRMVTDPAPDSAGIRYLFSMVLNYGTEFGFEKDFIETVRDRLRQLAPVPTGIWKNRGSYIEVIEDKNSFAPAGRFNPLPGLNVKRAFNKENPELYLIYPFALYDANSDKSGYMRAVQTFKNRNFIFFVCVGSGPCAGGKTPFGHLLSAD